MSLHLKRRQSHGGGAVRAGLWKSYPESFEERTSWTSKLYVARRHGDRSIAASGCHPANPLTSLHICNLLIWACFCFRCCLFNFQPVSFPLWRYVHRRHRHWFHESRACFSTSPPKKGSNNNSINHGRSKTMLYRFSKCTTFDSFWWRQRGLFMFNPSWCIRVFLTILFRVRDSVGQ